MPDSGLIGIASSGQECALCGRVKTPPLADPAYSFVSSSLMKVVLGNGGNADGLLPPAVVDRVRARFAELAATDDA